MKLKNDDVVKCPHCNTDQTEGVASDYVTNDPRNYGNKHVEECEWCCYPISFIRTDADTVEVNKA